MNFKTEEIIKTAADTRETERLKRLTVMLDNFAYLSTYNPHHSKYDKESKIPQIYQCMSEIIESLRKQNYAPIPEKLEDLTDLKLLLNEEASSMADAFRKLVESILNDAKLKTNKIPAECRDTTRIAVAKTT